MECHLTVQALQGFGLAASAPCPKCNFFVMDHEVEAVKAAKSVITVPTPVAVVPVAAPVGPQDTLLFGCFRMPIFSMAGCDARNPQ